MFVSGILVLIGALVAFSVSAVCGGGAGLLLLPLLGTLLPAAQVPAALSLGTATSSLSRITVFFSSIRWSIVLWFVPAALPAVWVGAWLLKFVNPLYIELVMGALLVANLPALFKQSPAAESTRLLPRGYLVLIGAAAGFVSGLTGAVGLLFNRFYLHYGLKKEQIVATRAANELLLHAVKLALYASFGLLSGNALVFGTMIAVAALGSSWGMKWLLPRLSEQLFRRVGYGAMVVSGLSLFAGAASRLLTDNRVGMSYTLLSDGLETKLQWRQGVVALEFEYDEGFEFEHQVSLSELPANVKTNVKTLSRGADQVVLEEVFGINKHYYEAYIHRQEKLEKVDL